MARTHYRIVPTILIRDRYPVEEAIAGLDVPLLVILGAADSIVPPRLSLRVFEAANQPKRLVEMEGLDHNHPGLASGTELAEEINVFVGEQVLASDSTVRPGRGR